MLYGVGVTFEGFRMYYRQWLVFPRVWTLVDAVGGWSLLSGGLVVFTVVVVSF